VRPIPRVAVPLTLPPVDELVAGVRAKWAAPLEVRRLVAEVVIGLEAWERDVFDRLVWPGARVLVVGCGAGRVALALAERCRVTGIDVVPALVQEARRLAAASSRAATFEVTAAEALLARAPACFDVVFVAAQVYEQTPGGARRVAFLRTLTALSVRGGLIVLCAGWHRDRGPRRALIDGVRWLLRRLRVRNVAEPGDRLLYHLSMTSDHTTSCFLHAFQRPEDIAAEIRRAGLVADRHPEGAWLLRPGTR
jgi:SAM-dependent methyltransferase